MVCERETDCSTPWAHWLQGKGGEPRAGHRSGSERRAPPVKAPEAPERGSPICRLGFVCAVVFSCRGYLLV